MIDRLHYITQEGLNGESHAAMAERACKAGVRWVQLRIKNATEQTLLEQAQLTRQVTAAFGATLLINDHVAVAKAVNADGVHLGKEDMDPAEARRILGDKIIGGTANTYDDVVSLIAKGVDYVGLGPFRFTKTKEKLSPILGLDGYQQLIGQLQTQGHHVPIIGIGGVLPEDVSALRSTGLHGVAVASVINSASDPALVIQQLYEALQPLAKPA
ncbi:thiamine phosphate synthase [Marinoscillum furvescens]|uniref:Thiamine-phosphate synthase n=1 Tax=Marinoscillum furvescens DSM 4134 TaxID=1122208 RepID=A0A3D9L7B9_MARFU|nr:thiamine phosphate synthase [Marinoscillum furvescens]REE01781.1 thiamine-phosphate diphosphorylase [Marinoscillum furvescens DSM 4134]